MSHSWHLCTNGGETQVEDVANIILGSDDGLVRFLDDDDDLLFAAPVHGIIYMKRFDRPKASQNY